MEGRMRPYLPELTIRDYNIYQWYLRGVLHQMNTTYGFYSCRLLQHNGVLFALLADSLAGREATCRNIRLPWTLYWKPMMCQTQGIRLAAQVEVLLGWHKLQDRRWEELPFRLRVRRALDRLLLRRAYQKAGQEQAQALVQMNLSAQNYTVVAEPMSNIYGALYSTLATDDPGQRKRMRYIGSCVGRIFYLLEKAGRVVDDKRSGRYNVFLVNGIEDPAAALENARRQSLAIANDMVRAYGMLAVKLNKSLIDNIMVLGLRHAVEPLDAGNQPVRWELP